MKTKSLKTLICAVALVASSAAFAEIISIGGDEYENTDNGQIALPIGGGEYENNQTGAILLPIGGGEYEDNQTGQIYFDFDSALEGLLDG